MLQKTQFGYFALSLLTLAFILHGSAVEAQGSYLTEEQSQQLDEEFGTVQNFNRQSDAVKDDFYRRVGLPSIAEQQNQSNFSNIENTPSFSQFDNSYNPDEFNTQNFDTFDGAAGIDDSLGFDDFGMTAEQNAALLNELSEQTLQNQGSLNQNVTINNYNQLSPEAQQILSQRYDIDRDLFDGGTQAERDQVIQQYAQDLQSNSQNASAQAGSGTSGPLGPTTQTISFTGAREAGRVEFQPLDGAGTGIAGFTDAQTGSTLAGIMNAGYQLLIGIASVLAVVMIFYAGFRYATTVSPGAKSDAKNRILAALGGLLLALSSWLILSTIDDDLVGVEFQFEGFEEGALTFDLQTENGREALNREHQSAIIVGQGSSITPQGSTGTTGSIGGIATSGTVVFPSGERFPAVQGTNFGGIDYTDGGGGRFARGVGLIDTQGKENVLLSKDFKVRDFKTHDGARYARISPRVVQGLQNIRDRAQVALTLTSAYRHPAYNNRNTGSGTTGAHTAGHAIDIKKPSNMSYEQLARLVIDEFGCNIGLGMGGNMVHFDFRGTHQSWAYRGYTNNQVDSFYDDYCKGKY